MTDRYDDFEIEKTPEEELDSLDYFDEDEYYIPSMNYISYFSETTYYGG